LARATGQQLSRRQIIEALGGDYLQYDERRLEALISRLRKKLELAGLSPQTLTAVRGQGYALQVALHERISNSF
jgi:DNA-binding response OmpR family regulator